MTIFQKLLDNPEAIIALFAFLTSIVSIFLTIKTLNTQKQHNLKSIRPIGYITVVNYDNFISISITNNGTGPLLIKDFKVSNSQNTISSNNLIDIIPSEINKKVKWSNFLTEIINRAIIPGYQLHLLRLKPDEINNDIGTIRALRKFLQHLTLTLKYTDIYESEIYSPVIKELDKFGKDLDV